MRTKIYQNAPLVLFLLSAILWSISFGLSELTSIPDGYIWMPYVLPQTFITILCGIILKKFYHGMNTDVLTGLCNRLCFYEILSRELERVNRTKIPVSLVLLDVDNFKQVNDTYGHYAGDDVLKQLASIFKQNTRTIDTVARWGGEEFGIIQPGTDRDGARVFAERLLKTIERSTKVTISIGIATAISKIDTDNFMVKADEALYRAKESKNTVVMANGILSQPKIAF